MRGFSLVELLMVIAACGVLIDVSIPLVLTYHPGDRWSPVRPDPPQSNPPACDGSTGSPNRLNNLLWPLLLLQFLLLCGFLVLCVAAGPHIDPNAANAILAGMLGVSAMAVQNTLPQISLTGAPSTAVMTTNVTRFMMDVGEVLLGRDPDEVTKARSRAKNTWLPIVGFTVGCGVGAACESAVGLWSLALPTGLALVAFAIGFAAMR